MKKILFIISVLILAAKTYSQEINDTIIIHRNVNETFTLKAPQKFYYGYKWDKLDNVFAHSKSYTLKYSSAGTYFVRCTAYDQCSSIEDPKIYRLVIGTGVIADSNISYTSLYPNPVSNAGFHFVVSCTRDDLMGTIKIINMNNAQEVFNREYYLYIGTNTFSFTNTLLPLTAGTYNLIFSSGLFQRSIQFIKL